MWFSIGCKIAGCENESLVTTSTPVHDLSYWCKECQEADGETSEFSYPEEFRNGLM